MPVAAECQSSGVGDAIGFHQAMEAYTLDRPAAVAHASDADLGFGIVAFPFADFIGQVRICFLDAVGPGQRQRTVDSTAQRMGLGTDAFGVIRSNPVPSSHSLWSVVVGFDQDQVTSRSTVWVTGCLQVFGGNKCLHIDPDRAIVDF